MSIIHHLYLQQPFGVHCNKLASSMSACFPLCTFMSHTKPAVFLCHLFTMLFFFPFFHLLDTRLLFFLSISHRFCLSTCPTYFHFNILSRFIISFTLLCCRINLFVLLFRLFMFSFDLFFAFLLLLSIDVIL